MNEFMVQNFFLFLVLLVHFLITSKSVCNEIFHDALLLMDCRISNCLFAPKVVLVPYMTV